MRFLVEGFYVCEIISRDNQYTDFFPLVEIKSEKCLDTNGSLPKLSDLKMSYLREKEKSIEPYKKTSLRSVL